MDPGHGLNDHIVSRPVPIGAAGAEAADRTTDDPGVDLLEGFIIHLEPLQDAGPEIVKDDVGYLYQIIEDLPPLSPFGCPG